MPFVRVDLQLVGFICFYEQIDKFRRVEKVHVFVDEAVNDQQSIVSVWMEEENRE